MAANIKDLNVENFEENVVKNSRLAVVDFWAPWCGYCVRMMPLYDVVAENLGDKVDFFKVNTDDNLDLAKEYNIEILPTFAVFKDGKMVDHVVGYKNVSELQTMITAHL